MKRVGVLLSAWLMMFAIAAPTSVRAQDITGAHLGAAWDAIRALGVNTQFDEALPNLSEQVQSLLMQRRPDLSRQIAATVNQIALDLVVRRRELNDDAARIWALTFTEEELIAIAAFYNSEAGRKLAQNYPGVLQETAGAVDAWYQLLAEEMLDRTLQAFQQQGIVF